MAFKHLHEYMIERYKIFLAKQAGKPKPWTNDAVLRAWKFTNVKRSDDRTTRELITRLYKPNYNAPAEQVLLNAGIARYFGTWEFSAAAGWQTTFKPAFLKKLATDRLAKRERVFTGAYVITNQGIKDKKQNVVVDIFLHGLWQARRNIIQAYKEHDRWEDAAGALMRVEGFGGTGFMAKEVLQDCMLTAFMAGAADRETWSPCGPGARRGLNRIYGLAIDSSWKEEDALGAMQDLRDEVLKHWPKGFPALDLHDIQFALCEWDKYQRVALGEGKPRSKYQGV